MKLLAVVVILLIVSIFIMPQITSLIKEENYKEVRLIEQKALVSAKRLYK